MEFNFTAKDKFALKSLSGDLHDMFSMKRVEDRLEDPKYRRVFDASFFRTVEGDYLDEMLDWIEDFRSRMDAQESKESKEELDSEARELIDAGWIEDPNETKSLKL